MMYNKKHVPNNKQEYKNNNNNTQHTTHTHITTQKIKTDVTQELIL